MESTIRDVARRAQVSISTVSRVLNNTTPVSADKRERVLEAVQALGYSPNPAARSLLKQETGSIGVLLPFVSGEFFTELLNGIDQTVQVHDYSLMISASHRHESEFRAALKGLHRRVDGFLIMAPEMPAESVRDLLPKDLPVVFINTQMESDTFDVFNFDNYGGMYALTEHLLQRGHRRIAFITGSEEAHDAKSRLRAYLDAGRAYGEAWASDLVFEGDFSAEAGYKAAKRILQSTPRPTAILAANDESAQGALRALLKEGVRVPEEMALGGFDDIPSARFMTPTLSTVRVPVREVAVRGVNRLMERVVGGSSLQVEQHTLPLELIIRESTGGSLQLSDRDNGHPR